MVASPIPIAVALESGLVLRGHEFSVDGPPIVFVHDLDEDLDAWIPLTSQMAAQGFRVISIDLRGHGLSDGGRDASSIIDDIRAMVGEIKGSFGPAGLVTYGEVAYTTFFIDENWGAPTQVAVSPIPPRTLNLDIDQTKPAMRMIVHGKHDAESSTFVDESYGRIRGQKLLVSTGSDLAGPALIREHPSLFEQIVIFMRRYLTGHQLKFIEDHKDEIAARARQIAAARDTESE